MTTFSIETWVPKNWNQVVGNYDLVEHYQDQLRGILSGDMKGLNTMIVGPSRSGKTGVTKLFVQCALCEQLDKRTLNPCSEDPCHFCKGNWVREGLEHMWAEAYGAKFHYIPIDCSIDSDDFRKKTKELTDIIAGIRIVYLDEVHRLHRVHSPLEETLLVAVNDTNITWLASSVSTEALEPMFLKRFTIINTQLPTEDELVEWLDDRCEEWGIAVDDPETLILLATRAKLVPGDTLRVLARAYKKDPRLLTRKLVESHRFIP